MRRKLKALAATLAVAMLALSGCGGSSRPAGGTQSGGQPAPAAKAPQPAADKKVTLKLGHALQAGHTVDQAAHKLAELAAAKSGGTIEIQVFPAQQLGNEKDMLENLSLGTLDMGAIVAGPYGYLQPDYQIASLAYVFRSPEHAEKVLNGPVGQEMANKLLKERQVRILDPFWYYGTRHLTANKQIKTPTDLKGLKIRVPEVPIHKDGLVAMGATATPVDFGELYVALKNGVVDGQENPVTTIKSAAIYQVNKYLMLTGHIIANFMVSINEGVWQRLSPAQQQALQEAVREAGRFNNQMVLKSETETLEWLRTEGGMTIVEVDQAAFAKAVGDLYKRFQGKQWSDGLFEKIQAVK